MPNILFITTQYRSGERIYPIIPHLSKQYDLDLLKIYHMHPTKGKWGGNIDGRKTFDTTYKQYFKNYYNELQDIDFKKYDLIIADDCRLQSGLGEIYQKRKCLMIGNSHGNNRINYPVINYQKCFDGCFVFGEKEITHQHLIPGGIPSNDELEKYKNIKKQHVLLITNFLGNKPTYTDPWGFHFLPMDKNFFDSLRLLDLQKKYNLPIKIKIKSREDGNYEEDINYIKSLLPLELDYKVLVDVDDDNLLIAESEIVIGHPSTMMLKPLQLQIPTAMFKNYGYGDEGSCIYKNCNQLIELEYNQMIKTLESPPNLEFIDKTVIGGLDFNSIDYYIHYIEQIILHSNYENTKKI
tara:strand:- start:12640 stop:13695 length:1056 start_codon:yes stop_codon:yes gene_type:complete